MAHHSKDLKGTSFFKIEEIYNFVIQSPLADLELKEDVGGIRVFTVGRGGEGGMEYN